MEFTVKEELRRVVVYTGGDNFGCHEIGGFGKEFVPRPQLTTHKH